MARKSKKLLRKKSAKRSKLNKVRLGKKVTRQRKPWKKRTMRGGVEEPGLTLDDALIASDKAYNKAIKEIENKEWYIDNFKKEDINFFLKE